MFAIGSDHGGLELKNLVIEWLKGWGVETNDVGCYDNNSVDYPDLAHKVCEEVLSDKSERGILVCGTGIGMSIAANRYKNIRATLVSDNFTARMSRMHNDSNVLVLGGRVLGIEIARDIVKTWLDTEFEGDRHITRLNKIEDIG